MAISLEKALMVLLAAVLLQSVLHLRSSHEVWRSNLAAELSLADTLLQQEPREVDESI